MLRLRFRDVKVPVANALSLSSSDSTRLASYVNRAVQRLLEEGPYMGTYGRFRICIGGTGCLTWPREIETIEAAALDTRPVTLRSEWYEFYDGGPGIGHGGTFNWPDQGEAPAFDDVTGTGKKLAVYCDKQEDPGKTITLQFYDGNGNFVTSTWNGQIIDGERIALPAVGTYAYTANTISAAGLARVYKDETKGTVRLYEYDPATTALKPLGYYQRDETVPVYRRTLIPNFNPGQNTFKSVVVQASLRFIPVFDDDDFLQISQVEAIRLGAQAVLKEENSKLNEAVEFWALANAVLQKQLKRWKGMGAVKPISFNRQYMPKVPNLI